MVLYTCADPEKGAGRLRPCMNIHNNIGFSSTGSDSLKNHNATKLAFLKCWFIIGTCR